MTSPIPWLRAYLARDAVRTLVSNTHSGEDHEAPPETFQETPLAGWVPLGKVDETGEGENADKQQTHQEEQLLVCLTQGYQKALKAVEMSHKLKFYFRSQFVFCDFTYLEYSENPHNPDESENLPHPSDHEGVLHSLQNEAEVVGEYGKNIDHIQWTLQEIQLVWSTRKSHS